MNKNDIVAFRATGETRKRIKGEFSLCDEGAVDCWLSTQPSAGERPILIPIPPAEIAAALRTLGAVEKWKETLRELTRGNVRLDVSQMAKEILGL